MANMDFCDKHNMVAFLQKPTGSEEFHQIVDFLAGSHIRYALTANPTIYVSLIEQFWQTVTVDTVNDGEQQLTVTVDGQTIAITEASVRRHLQLADADGISSLPNTEIFDQLTLMGYVSNDDKLTFQKGGYTPGSDEDSKKLNELTELSLTKLVMKVKHLKAKLKSTTKRRKARMQFTPTKVTQGEEQCQESFEAQLSVLSAAKILANASREKVKTYTRRRSTDSLRDSIARGLFSTAEKVQGKEHISTDEKVAQKLNDEEMLNTIKRYQTLKKKPVSVAQARKNMMIYLKNMAGYKMGYFKGISYDEIRSIFEEEYNKKQTLFKKDTEVEKTKTKRIVEETLLQESFKKLRTVEA
ncbi:hypothetical protein Tco_1135032 [Tanacetum coccineum]